jgi:hypothetical protein
MEKRLNKKVEEFLTLFKENIKFKTQEMQINDADRLMQYIYDYERLVFDKDDLAKRKRIKNVVPYFERCSAKRANGQQCTRRKKTDFECCGTHVKGSPHGYFEIDEQTQQTKLLQVVTQDIRGIVYHIDDTTNVYDTEDVIKGVYNPRIIAKYVKNMDSYSIPEFNI